MKAIAILTFSACAAWAQDAPPPAFEVASVKVAAPFSPGPSPGGGAVRIARGCGKPDPAMVRCNGATLKMLLMRAYDVKTYQIQAPDWVNSENYDVMAKVPEGIPAEKIPAMLQTLLAERFAMKVHKETRVLPAYELTVAKGGPKMKEVDLTKLAVTEPGAPPPPPPPGGPGGRPVSSMPAGSVMFGFGSNSSRTLRGNMTATQLVNAFTSFLNRPVFDATDLKATYEVDLQYLGTENDGMGMAMIGGLSPGAGPGRGDAPAQDANAPIATIFQAVKQTLGLSLDAKKAPVEMIVVDSANKTPTEN